MLDDIAQVMRAVRRHWQRTTSSVLILALGLTVSASLFSVLDGVLLKPLPVRAPDELFIVGPPSPVRRGQPGSVSWDDLTALVELPLVDLAAGYAKPSGFFQRVDAEHESLRDAAVTPGFFDTLGITPVLGRLLHTSDALIAEPRAVVVGHGLWRDRYGGDARILGRRTVLGGRPVVVVGILPAEFTIPGGTNVWVPADVPKTTIARGSRGFAAVVRARTATPKSLQTIRLPSSSDDVIARPLPEFFAPADGRSVLALFLATGLAVVIAWIHLGTQQASLCVERAREIAVRAVLGASAVRLVRHSVVESLALSALAIAVACGALPSSLRLLVRLLPPEVTLGRPVIVDYRTLAYLAGLTVAASAALSVGPALVLRRAELTSLLRGQVATVSGRRRAGWRSLLAAAQVALVSTLLYVAALALHGWARLVRVDLGVKVDRLLSVELPPTHSEESARQQFELVRQRLASLPMVLIVAAGPLPLDAGRIHLAVLREWPLETEDWRGERNAFAMPASPEYFSTVGARVVTGSAAETRTRADVVLLSASLARLLSPAASLLGRDVFVSGERATVVGIVGDMRGDGPDRPPRPYVFLPADSYRREAIRIYGEAVVRTKTQAGEAAGTIADAVRDVVGQRVRLVPAEQVYQRATAPARSRALLLAALAVSALCLALFSIYATTKEAIRRRLHEMAVRVALGAPQRHVVVTLAAGPLLAVATGAAIGVGAGVAIGRWASSVWYGVHPWDPASMIAVAVSLLAATAVGAVRPALLAARGEPLTALREE